MMPGKLVTILSVCGILVSIYALRVEMLSESNENYEAMCDLSEHVRCTHVLSSRWGRGFGVIGYLFGEDSILNQPNSIAGIAFYLVVLYLNFLETKSATQLIYVMAVASNFMSIYLAAILYFILYDFCIVCVTTYAINGVLLYAAWQKRNNVIKID